MTEHNFEHMRRAMVASQLRTTGINDPRVLAAIGAVPRERFVPNNRVAMAYADALVPIGNGRELNSPMSFGRLLSESGPRHDDKALLIGAATGYGAAVLARLVGSVTAVEEDPELAAAARAALEGTGVKLVEAPLSEGHAAGAPYDLILIDGAVELIPEALIEQIADGGRMAAALLDRGVAQISVGRRGGDGFGMAAVSDVASAMLPGFARPRIFTF
jgi:protein-L-isoaspartate(D-aspartate) O-methyltransferase